MTGLQFCRCRRRRYATTPLQGSLLLLLRCCTYAADSPLTSRPLSRGALSKRYHERLLDDVTSSGIHEDINSGAVDGDSDGMVPGQV
jgi:hypothetical protein